MLQHFQDTHAANIFQSVFRDVQYFKGSAFAHSLKYTDQSLLVDIAKTNSKLF